MYVRTYVDLCTVRSLFPFQILCFNVVVSENCGQRIDIRTMMAEAAANEKQEAKNRSLSPSSSLRQRSKVVNKSSTLRPQTPPNLIWYPTSLFSRLSTLTRRSLSTRVQPVSLQVYQVVQDMLTFVEADEDLMDMLSDQASMQHSRAIPESCFRRFASNDRITWRTTPLLRL